MKGREIEEIGDSFRGCICGVVRIRPNSDCQRPVCSGINEHRVFARYYEFTRDVCISHNDNGKAIYYPIENDDEKQQS